MKYLKSYKIYEFYKNVDAYNNVCEICKKYNITNFTFNDDDCSIDVDDTVDLSNKGLEKIPLKFRKVNGTFHCDYNKLTSLEGCPQIVGEIFECGNNKLTSLEGGPQIVGHDYFCNNNKLTSLEGCPKNIGGYFYMFNNKIKSFEGFPESIGGELYCENNPIHYIWDLFANYSKIELFNDYDIIRDDNTIILDRLNDFLTETGKKPIKPYTKSIGMYLIK